MLSLAQFDLPLLAVALLIGLATAYWMFRGGPPRHDPEDIASS
jgi:hypothetical protein